MEVVAQPLFDVPVEPLFMAASATPFSTVGKGTNLISETNMGAGCEQEHSDLPLLTFLRFIYTTF